MQGLAWQVVVLVLVMLSNAVVVVLLLFLFTRSEVASGSKSRTEIRQSAVTVVNLRQTADLELLEQAIWFCDCHTANFETAVVVVVVV